MAGDNDQQLFIIDSELVERMLRGDVAPQSVSQQGPAPDGLASAVALASQGRLNDAVRELETVGEREENAVDLQVGLANLRFEQENWSEAEKHYSAAVNSSPNRILFGKAVALHKLGHLDQAADLYNKLLSAEPNSVNLLSNLVSLSASRKDEARVKELASRLLKIQPESRAALEGLASIALSREDYNAAVQHCSILVKAQADSYEGWFNLGVAHHELGQYKQAANAYQNAVRLRPESVEANANLGAVLHGCGDMEGACAASRRAFEAAPQLSGVLWNLAITTEALANFHEAQKLFAKLLALHPDREDAAFRLGHLQLQHSEYSAAANSFKTCLEKRDNWQEALLNWALASWKSSDLDNAVTGFHRVLLLDPKNAVAMGCLSAVLAEQKNSGEAIYWYRKVAAEGKPSPKLSFNVGILMQSVGDHAAAVACYRSAIDGQTEFPEALLNLGYALKAAGRDDEARQVWSEAMTANPALAGDYFQ